MAVSGHTFAKALRGAFQAGKGPPARQRITIYSHIAAAIVCLLLSTLVIHRTAGRIPDDAFILFRYAQNVLDGQGWVYNLNHPTTNAVSAPLYALMLVWLGLLTGNIELAATILFVLTTAASGYLAFAVLHKNSMALGGLAAMFLMIVNPWLLVTRGLETSAFVCLLLLSILLIGARMHATLGFVLVAATLVRGDAAIFAAVAFALLWMQLKGFPWRLMAGAAAATIIWTFTAVMLGVSIIPDTLAAKFAQGRSGLWGDVLYLPGFLLTPEIFGFAAWATGAALLAGAGLLLLGGLHGLRQYLGPFIIGAVLLFAAYALIIRPPSYHWYYGPQLALMALGGGITIAVLARTAAANVIRTSGARQITESNGWLARLRSRSLRARATALTLAVFMIAIMSVTGWRDIQSGPDRPAYIATAEWLKGNTPDDATVALTEIGIVGWYSKREMVDFLGLLSKDSVAEIANGDSISWLAREEPDYWIVHQPAWQGMEAAAGEPWFPLAYQPVWTNGDVVAWRKFRRIADAKLLAATAIKPASNRICDQLEVPKSDTMTQKSIAALISLISVRDDLRTAYTKNRRLDLDGLLEWASSPAIRTDTYGAAVQQFESLYREISPRASRVQIETPPAIR